jgi:hypothetical protein
MTAEIKINMDNTAFENRPATELARILRALAKRVEAGQNYVPLMDFNGNKVGEFNIVIPRDKGTK